MQIRGNALVFIGQHHFDYGGHSGGALSVADVALEQTDRESALSLGFAAIRVVDGLGLLRVAHLTTRISRLVSPSCDHWNLTLVPVA